MSLFNKIEAGLILELGSHTFDAESIKRFARKFDPQPFHLDEVAAKNSLLGGLCASGWHSISVWMRMNLEVGRKQLETKTGYQGPKPQFGVSPGIKNIRWPRPVYADDTITYKITVTGKRSLQTKPDWGLLLTHSEGFNQNGEKVLEFDASVMLKII